MELLLRESDAASRENGDKVKTSGQAGQERRGKQVALA